MSVPCFEPELPYTAQLSALVDAAEGRHEAALATLEPLRGMPEFDRIVAKAARRVADFSA